MTGPISVEVVVPSGADKAYKLVMCGYYVFAAGVLLFLVYPDLRRRAWDLVDQAVFPFRYRFWYMSLPIWHREALIVRGQGIPGTA